MFRNEIILFLLMVWLVKDSKESLEEDIGKRINHSDVVEKSLSRKRRYLTFPSGSSLQLVYCLTMPSVGLGEIFTFGLTAALAWELPSNADELLMSFGKKPITSTTTEAPTTTLPPHHDVESDYQELSPHPSQKKGGYGSSNYLLDNWTYKNIRDPAPVQTLYDPFRLKQNLKHRDYSDISTGQLYTSRQAPSYNGHNGYSYDNLYNNLDDSYIHPVYHQIHRRTRRDLYVKLEKLLSALSKDGKACLRKAICEVSQVPKGKGTLFQELMKTIFRVKPHDDYTDEDDYDKAADKSHICSERYSSCKHSVWTDMF